jgi:hypothetical protein
MDGPNAQPASAPPDPTNLSQRDMDVFFSGD